MRLRQAEYLRVPVADVNKTPDSVTGEQAAFLADVFPTGYVTAVNAQIEPETPSPIWAADRSASSQSGSTPAASSQSTGAERLAVAEAGGAETTDLSSSTSAAS